MTGVRTADIELWRRMGRLNQMPNHSSSSLNSSVRGQYLDNSRCDTIPVRQYCVLTTEVAKTRYVVADSRFCDAIDSWLNTIASHEMGSVTKARCSVCTIDVRRTSLVLNW